MLDTEVFICGGGPAGLAAAIAARQQGFEVVVADCFKPPIDKACGEGLMPDAVAALARLGVTLENCDGGVFKGVRFLDGVRSAEASFPGGAGRGIRRVDLHELLRKRAAELGIGFRWSTQITRPFDTLNSEHVLVHAGQEQFRARWIIGADGMNSRVRKWSGLEAGKQRSRRIGLRQHYRTKPWSDFVEIYWGPNGQAYITPVAADEVGVVVVARNPYGSIDSALNLFPALQSRLRNAECIGTERGALTTGQVYDHVTSGRAALVGDASASVDAITGAGLGLAFLHADALGHALRQDNLSLYERAHREIHRRPAFLSQSMLMMDRFAAIRGMSLASFQRNPWLLERMLSVHVGDVPLKVWGRNGVANLGLQLLCR